MLKSISCNDENRLELVERYLLGGMRKREQAAFEAHFAQCDACYDQLNQSQKMMADLQNAAKKAGWSKKEVAQLSQLYARRGFFADFNWKLVLAISLLLFAVFIVPLIWWANRPATQMKILVALEPETKLDAEVIDKTGTLQAALRLHQNGQYDEAIVKLTNLTRSLPLNASRSNAERLIGLSYLLKKQPEKALAHLQQAMVEVKMEGEEKALWYMGNAHLLLGNKSAAVHNFEQIIAMGGRIRSRAQRLLEKLEKINSRK